MMSFESEILFWIIMKALHGLGSLSIHVLVDEGGRHIFAKAFEKRAREVKQQNKAQK